MPPAPAKAVPVEVPETAPVKKGGGMMRLVKMILGAAICIGLGLGAGWYQFGQTDPLDDALRLIERTPPGATGPDGMPRATRALPEQPAFVTTYYAFEEPVTTNPAGSRRFLQVGVSLSTQYDPKVMTNVDAHKTALRSDMLAVIGSLSEDEITGREGRERLAGALNDALNERLEQLEGFGGIEGVYFTSFILQ